MFLSSEDVSDKYIVTKTIQKTAIEYDLSLNVNTDCVYSKAIFSKQVVKNLYIKEEPKMETSVVQHS